MPSTFGISDVQELLSPEGQAAVLVGSLAPDADSVDSASHQIATATIEPLYGKFLELQPDHSMQLAYRDIAGQSGYVIIDCSFHGLTTLANPRSKPEIVME